MLELQCDDKILKYKENWNVSIRALIMYTLDNWELVLCDNVRNHNLILNFIYMKIEVTS
jgi:hypothetical protein